MSFEPDQFRTCIVEPTLKYLDLYSPAAVELLMGTAAQESHLGTYLVQVGGPARGIYQMEPATHRDIWANFLTYNGPLRDKVDQLMVSFPLAIDSLEGNLYYATAMARLVYYRDSKPLPKAGDLDGLAAYWKRVYNTKLGKGTVQEFKRNYMKFVTRKE